MNGKLMKHCIRFGLVSLAALSFGCAYDDHYHHYPVHESRTVIHHRAPVAGHVYRRSEVVVVDAPGYGWLDSTWYYPYSSLDLFYLGYSDAGSGFAVSFGYGYDPYVYTPWPAPLGWYQPWPAYAYWSPAWGYTAYWRAHAYHHGYHGYHGRHRKHDDHYRYRHRDHRRDRNDPGVARRRALAGREDHLPARGRRVVNVQPIERQKNARSELRGNLLAPTREQRRSAVSGDPRHSARTESRPPRTVRRREDAVRRYEPARSIDRRRASSQPVTPRAQGRPVKVIDHGIRYPERLRPASSRGAKRAAATRRQALEPARASTPATRSTATQQSAPAATTRASISQRRGYETAAPTTRSQRVAPRRTRAIPPPAAEPSAPRSEAPRRSRAPAPRAAPSPRAERSSGDRDRRASLRLRRDRHPD
ncbi:MAG: hypothetical protein Kow0020_01990 [Wenzhouxiangellaceae bacterium]